MSVIKTKITTPQEMESPRRDLEHALGRFETALSVERKGYPTYHLIISGELPKSLREEIEKVYKDNGWKNVSCITSPENKERPGLTSLILSTV